MKRKVNDQTCGLVYEHLQHGKKYAKTAAKIQEEICLPPEQTSETVRTAIQVLIERDLIPVGSCSEGYYIIDTDRELAEVTGDLDGRTEAIQFRRRRIEVAYFKSKGMTDKGVKY